VKKEKGQKKGEQLPTEKTLLIAREKGKLVQRPRKLLDCCLADVKEKAVNEAVEMREAQHRDLLGRGHSYRPEREGRGQNSVRKSESRRREEKRRP